MNLSQQTYKILLVEDNELNQKFAIAVVRKLGYEMDIASNGLIGVQLFKENTYDLILMDIQMPEMNGYEAVRQIRKFDKKMIIIAQTAFALINDREKSIRAGCNDYLTKPIVKRELEFLIQKHF